MRYVDMHCDTLMNALLNVGKGADLYEMSQGMQDLKRMKQGDYLAQFFAIFIVPENSYRERLKREPIDENEYIDACIEIFYNSIEAHSDIIAAAGNADDILENQKKGLMSAVLTMEDGCAVRGRMENLERFYDAGVRALSLTWNGANCFGAPNSADPEIMKKGLTDFGKDAIVYMQDKGMLVDVSHLSDGGFYDVAKICRKPFAATHSNCRALCPHQRNLTDEMIRILGNAGGVAGMNFEPTFLNKDVTCKDSRAEMIAKHARHMADVGGVECVGMGSDFDGISGNLEISGGDKIGLLEAALQKEHFSGSEIDKIVSKNVLRVMKDTMK